MSIQRFVASQDETKALAAIVEAHTFSYSYVKCISFSEKKAKP